MIRMTEKKRAVLHYEAKEVALNVIKFFKAESMNNGPIYPLDQVTTRASEATGISEKIVLKLGKELELEEPGCFASKLTKIKKVKPNIDEFRLLALRNLITSIYTVHRERPTLKRIHDMSRNELGLRLSFSTLRTVLIEIMGYKYMRLSGCKVFIENPELRLLRMQYIRTIRKYSRDVTTTIFYLNEMWLYAQYALYMKQTGRSLEWTYIYIVSENRSCLIGTPPQTPVTDIDPTHFEEWLKDVFLPNLPSKNMVIVLDNASTDSVTTENWITPHSKKIEMMIWLYKNRVPFESVTSNIELYGLVKNNRKPKKYVIDETLKDNNYPVLRLPKFCCDLNPLKLMQRIVNKKVALSNISDANEIEAAILRENQALKNTDWAREVEYVKCLEQEYEEQELQMERELENYISDADFIDVSDSEMNIEEDILDSDDEEFLDK